MAPNILLRAAWFLLVGWWLTPLVLFVAWLLHVPIVTIPLGIKFVNQTPRVLTLKPPSEVGGLRDPEAADPPVSIRCWCGRPGSCSSVPGSR